MSFTKAKLISTLDSVDRKEQTTIHDFNFELNDNFRLNDLLFKIKDRFDIDYRVDAFNSNDVSKNICDNDCSWFLWNCGCGEKKRHKMICSSFFCPECNENYATRLRHSMKDYLLNCNHRVSVFTTPQQIWGQIDHSNMNLLFDAVHATMNEYRKRHKKEYDGQVPQVGEIAIPHTYGSMDLGWKPHINLFTSTLGFIKCTWKHHHRKNVQELDKEKTKFVTELYGGVTAANEKLKAEIIKKDNCEMCRQCKFYECRNSESCVGLCKKKNIVVEAFNSCMSSRWATDKDIIERSKADAKECKNIWHTVSTAHIDYNEIRQIYKSELMKRFDLEDTEFNPQVKFDDQLEKDDDMFELCSNPENKFPGVSVDDLLGNRVDYFKRIPLTSKNITFVDNRMVGFTTHKREQEKMSWMFMGLRDFYFWVVRHIPEPGSKTMRLWGVYHYQNKIRKLRSQQSVKSIKDKVCPECKMPMIYEKHKYYCSNLNCDRQVNIERPCPHCKHQLGLYIALEDGGFATVVGPTKHTHGKRIGWACSNCYKFVPFSYYTIAFSKGIDTNCSDPQCKKCKGSMDLAMSVICNRVHWINPSYLSNNKFNLKDFSHLFLGSAIDPGEFEHISLVRDPGG